MISSTPLPNKYVLDTNILINFAMWRPLSMCPEFWDRMSETLKEGKWILLDVVVDEIKYDDDLIEWCKKQKNNALITILPDECRERAVEINNRHPMIDEVTAKSTVDTFIVSFAELNKLYIFTRESFKDSNKIDALHKIPDVCKLLHIKYERVPKRFLQNIAL